MFIDLNNCEPSRLNGPYDVIVVGSGAVGMTLAVRLAQANIRVLCLEAGAKTLEAQSQAIFEQAGWAARPLEGLHNGRFRMLGGTTNFWGGQLVPFDDLVFAQRPWVADDAWPFGLSELAPFYDEVLTLIGMPKEPATPEAIWQELKISAPVNTEKLEIFFTRWAPESNFLRLFQKYIETSSMLDIAVNAPVSGLGLVNNRISAVQVYTTKGNIDLSARHIVLANGTIEIARLLQLPLTDGGHAPWASNPWLGRGFLEHIDCFAADVDPIDKKRFHNIFDNAVIDRVKLTPKLRLSSKTQREQQLYGIAAHFLFNSSIGEHVHNAKVFFKGLLSGRMSKDIRFSPASLGALMRIGLPMMLRYFRFRRIYNFADRGIKLRLTAEQKLVRESCIRLTGKTDRTGTPNIEVDWRIGGDEIETLARFTDYVAEYLAKEELATLRIDPQLKARDPLFLTQADDANHHMGTARMSASPQNGVVDPQLRLHGIQNLYVAGAAVFPTTGFVNPTFTAMALGQRLAAHLTKALHDGK